MVSLPPLIRDKIISKLKESIDKTMKYIYENTDTLIDMNIKSIEHSLSRLSPDVWDTYVEREINNLDRIASDVKPMFIMSNFISLNLVDRLDPPARRTQAFILAANAISNFILFIDTYLRIYTDPRLSDDVARELTDPTTLAHAYLSFAYGSQPVIEVLLLGKKGEKSD